MINGVVKFLTYSTIIILISLLGSSFSFSKSSSGYYKNTKKPKGYASNIFNFKIAIDKIKYLEDNKTVLVLSIKEQRALLFSTKKQYIEKDLNLSDYSNNVLFTDLKVNNKLNFVYFIGSQTDSFPKIAILKLDLETLSTNLVTIEVERTPDPVMTVDINGNVYIGDFNANVVYIVENSYFDNSNSHQVLNSNNIKKIFLKKGPVNEIGTTNNGNFTFISFKNLSGISVIDNLSNEIIELIDTRKVLPIKMIINKSRNSRNNESSFLVLADYDYDLLVYTDFDEDFRTFDSFTTAKLGLKNRENVPNYEKEKINPFIISANQKLNVVSIGSQDKEKLLMFSRNRSSWERRNSISLGYLPVEISLSPDGQNIAILNSNHNTVQFIDNPLKYKVKTDFLYGSEKIRETQRTLSYFGYPIGVVDGFFGDETLKALNQFQHEQGIKITNSINQETIDSLFNFSKTSFYIDDKVLKILPQDVKLRKTIRISESLKGSDFIIREEAFETIIESPKYNTIVERVSTLNNNYPKTVLNRMIDLSYWKAVNDLENNISSTPFSLSVDFSHYASTKTKNYVVKDGTNVDFNITNQSSIPLYIYLIDALSDGTLNTLYPRSGERQKIILPGESIEGSFITTLPKGLLQAIGTIKAIATENEIDTYVLPKGKIRNSRMPTIRLFQNDITLHIADRLRGGNRTIGPNLSTSWSTQNVNYIIQNGDFRKKIF